MTATTAQTARWVLGYVQSYNWAQCRYCGRAQQHDCPAVACMLCGSVQCLGNGSARGECKLCFHGFLPGWGRTGRDRCGRKACDAPAVSDAPRVGQVCAEHAKTTKIRLAGRSITIADYAAERVALRDAGQLKIGHTTWRFVA